MPTTQPVPGPDPDRRRYELLADAARDLGKVESAYDAQLLVSTLLGSVYAMAGPNRADAVERFTTGFRRYLGRRRDSRSTLLRTVLDSLAPPARRRRAPEPGDSVPAWVPHLGTERLTGTWTYRDEYGDQVSYLATFGHADAGLGGPDHAVVLLVDRNIGIVKDLFVTAPASAVLDHLQATADADTTILMAPVEPAALRAEVTPYLAATDSLETLPGDDSLSGDRAIAVARLRQLPGGGHQDPVAEIGRMIADFRASAESDALVGAPGDAGSLTFCLDLITRHALGRMDADPLRWSPAAIESFLLDWVPRHALLDATDLDLLPRVLDAWVRWAGRVRDLPPRAVADTVVTIAQVRLDYLERTGSGEHLSEEAEAVAQMLAEGVDLEDPDAVARWIEAYNRRGTG